MTTNFSILAWRIPWTEELVGYSPRGCKESDTTERLSPAQHDARQRDLLFLSAAAPVIWE